MLARFAEHIVDWQIGRNILQAGERATYRYAYELLLNQMINVLIALMIAVFLHAPAEVFLFLLSYIPLRSYSGGYHANTHFSCTVVSALLTFFTAAFARGVHNEWILTYYPVIFLVSGYMIIKYAPVADKHKPLDELEVSRYRKRSRICWGIEAAAALLCYMAGIRLGIVLALSHGIMSLMLCLGILKNRKAAAV